MNHDEEQKRRQILASQEAALGKDHPDVAAALDDLAEVYVNRGDYALAVPLLHRALMIWMKVLGKDHRDVGVSMSNLAEAYRQQGDYSSAWPRYRGALAILEAALGKEHPDVATVLSNLALLYAEDGQYSAAEPLMLRALAIREKALAKSIPMWRVRSVAWRRCVPGGTTIQRRSRCCNARWR